MKIIAPGALEEGFAGSWRSYARVKREEEVYARFHTAAAKGALTDVKVAIRCRIFEALRYFD